MSRLPWDLDIARGEDLDRIAADHFGLFRNQGEPDSDLRERLQVVHLSPTIQASILRLRSMGWTVEAPGDKETLEGALRDAQAAQTALELAEKLLAIRSSPHGRKTTLRAVALFLGGKGE